jgi:hypothetical protein
MKLSLPGLLHVPGNLYLRAGEVFLYKSVYLLLAGLLNADILSGFRERRYNRGPCAPHIGAHGITRV